MAPWMKHTARTLLAGAILCAGAARAAIGDTIVRFRNDSGEKVRITVMPDQMRKPHGDNVAIRNPKTGKRIIGRFEDEGKRILPPRSAWIEDGESISFSYRFDGLFHTFFDLDFSIARAGAPTQAHFRYSVIRRFHGDGEIQEMEDQAGIVPLVSGKPRPGLESLAEGKDGAAGGGNPAYRFQGFPQPSAIRVRRPTLSEDDRNWGELLAIAGLSPLPAEPAGPGGPGRDGTPPRRRDFGDCQADSPLAGGAGAGAAQ